MIPLPGRSQPDQQQIDRLVDGELSEEERRRLLVNLDDDPVQWRQVALGFIESQCCINACRELTDSLPHDPDENPHDSDPLIDTGLSFVEENPTVAELVPEDSDSLHEHRSRHRAVRFLPVVASVAVAFSLGFVAQSRWTDWAERASNRLPTPNRFNGIPVAQIANQFPGLDGGFSAAELRKVKLPLVQRSDATEKWLNRSDRVVSPQLEQSLSRYGHLVSERRRVYPVQLKDGRRILVPVKDIELKYIGNRGYH